MLRRITPLLATPRLMVAAFAAASALILAAALVAQYGFGLAPCHLCLLQRYPYALVAAGGIMALIFLKKHAHLRACLLLFAVAFAVGGGIAAYHTGVEYGWVPAPATCSAEAGETLSVDEMRKQIMNAPLVSCAQPLAKPLGLSLAAWNFLLYAFLMVLGFKSYYRSKPT